MRYTMAQTILFHCITIYETKGQGRGLWICGVVGETPCLIATSQREMPYLTPCYWQQTPIFVGGWARCLIS